MRSFSLFMGKHSALAELAGRTTPRKHAAMPSRRTTIDFSSRAMIDILRIQQVDKAHLVRGELNGFRCLIPPQTEGLPYAVAQPRVLVPLAGLQTRVHDHDFLDMVVGFDHRVGHFWPRRMTPKL